MNQVKAHLLHREFHLDEIYCDWVRRKEGNKRYPGSATAEILIKGSANHKLGISPAELKTQGIECFGRWGGKFDEHSPTTPDKCSADLVTEDLGMTNPAIGKVLEFVRKTDLGPSIHQLDISSLVKLLHAVHRKDPIKVMLWGREALDAKYWEEMIIREGGKVPSWKSTPNLVTELLEVPDGPALQSVMKFARGDNHPYGLGRTAAAIKAMSTNGLLRAVEWAKDALDAAYQDQLAFQQAQEIVRNARWETLLCQSKEVSIVIACTDNRKFGAAARAAGAAVTIQRQPSGNVQIYPNQNAKQLGFRVNMRKVTAAIRLTEQDFKFKGKLVTTDQTVLESEGMVPGAEEWYYTGEKGQFILNGSTTADNDPTNLDDNTIIELVKKNVMVV